MTLTSIPAFALPAAPSLVNLSIFAQVAMLNPTVFPSDPLQLTHGLEVILDVGTVPYGSGGSGMALWMPTPPMLGSQVTFAFSIPGM